jgi:hypothetical protein
MQGLRNVPDAMRRRQKLEFYLEFYSRLTPIQSCGRAVAVIIGVRDEEQNKFMILKPRTVRIIL